MCHDFILVLVGGKWIYPMTSTKISTNNSGSIAPRLNPVATPCVLLFHCLLALCANGVTQKPLDIAEPETIDSSDFRNEIAFMRAASSSYCAPKRDVFLTTTTGHHCLLFHRQLVQADILLHKVLRGIAEEGPWNFSYAIKLERAGMPFWYYTCRVNSDKDAEIAGFAQDWPCVADYEDMDLPLCYQPTQAEPSTYQPFQILYSGAAFDKLPNDKLNNSILWDRTVAHLTAHSSERDETYLVNTMHEKVRTVENLTLKAALNFNPLFFRKPTSIKELTWHGTGAHGCSMWSFFGIFLVALFPAMYRGIHLIAWNFVSPTPVESLLWRVSSFTVMGAMPCWLSVLLLYIIIVNLVPGMMSLLEAGVLLFNYAGVVLYLGARAYLVVESFISLRCVPIGVYWTPSWLQMIPHA